MPFISVPFTAMFEIVQLCQGERVENTLYFEKAESGWTSAEMLDLSAALLAWWDDNLADLTSTRSRIIEIAATDLTTASSGSTTLVPTGGAGVGGNIDTALPNNVSACISFRSLGRGRNSRGRNFTVGMTTSFIEGNLLTPGYVTQLQTAYNALQAVATAAEVTWVIVSRFFNKAPRAEGVTFPVIAALVSDILVDSQRRRLAGRGN